MTRTGNLESDEALAAELSGRRPKRQRNPTTYYTDDKPNTFTTKRYRGQIVYGPSVPSTTFTARDELPSSFKSKISNGNNNATTSSSPRKKTPPSSSSSTSSSTAGVARSASSLSPPKKRGPGRPPKRSKSLENPALLLLGKVPPKTAVSSIHMTTTATTSQKEDRSITFTTTRNNGRRSLPTTTSPPAPVKRKRGRPPKNRPKEEEAPGMVLPLSPPARPSTRGSSTTSNSRINATMPSHGHATRRTGASLLSPKTTTATTTTSLLSSSKTLSFDAAKSAKWGRKSLDENSTKDIANTISTTTTTPKRTSATTAVDTATSHLADASTSPGRKQRGSNGRESSSSSQSLANTSCTTGRFQDVEGTFLCHPITMAAILPPVLARDNKSTKKNTDYDKTDDEPKQEVDEARLRARFPVVYETGVPPACANTTAFATKNSTSGSLSSASSLPPSSTADAGHAIPSWTPLYNPPIFFEDDYDAETGVLDLKSTLPVVSRKITAVAVRQPHRDYLALGDSIGFVAIYSLLPGSYTGDVGPRPVARLESVACQQRGRAEQERVRADILKRRNKGKGQGSSNMNNLFYSLDASTNALVSGSAAATQNGALGPVAAAAMANEANTPTAAGGQALRSIVMNTSDTNIHALAMIGNRVVLATFIELECMDIPSGTSLWVCPLSTNRIVTSLDMHLSTYDVLVSCSKTDDVASTTANGTVSAVEPAAVAVPTSPLMLLQHSKNNVEICDANSPMLVRSPSCTAIWDVGAENRLLFVALSSSRQELELVLVSGGSIDTWKVACKTKIPTKSPAHALSSTTKLSQSPGGHYALVASTRGIRLYETESLQLIQVYGDQLALHGQSVLWKDCWLAGSYYEDGPGQCHRSSLSGGGTSSMWLECNDWLAPQAQNHEDQDSSNGKAVFASQSSSPSSTPDLAPYIIGVPYAKKGPAELCEKLHVWKVEHGSVVPAMSIPLPRKGEGALGLVGGGGKSSAEDRLVLITNDGQGHVLLPKMESNFAGTMYPPGYQVITDNIEYIENEDALDEVMGDENPCGDNEVDDLDILGDGGNDEMDEELLEAMRQSLLELKKQEVAQEASSLDLDVDIVVPTSEEVSYLPCRPEPYLRQAINLQSEADDDEEGEEKEGDDKKEGQGISSSKDPIVPPGAAFVSNILDVMPNQEKPKPVVEEDCLSFTTTKVVVAMNPVVPARPGRGRKGRAGNLDALIKASINPYLQSLMMSKQGIPSDGGGCRATPLESRNTMSQSATSTTYGDSLAETTGGQNGSSMRSAGAIHPGTQGTPTPQAATDDEAAVALGLLGLSPCNTAPPINVPVAGIPKAPTNMGATVEKTSSRPSYLSASSLSTFANNVENSVMTAINAPLHAIDQQSHGSGAITAESIAASSDRSGTPAPSEDAGHHQRPHIDMRCLACRGRHVVHSCGRRALPIDYDEVAKVERERRAKEEEEKRRVRAEKRRLADQRRREAKREKQRELERQQLREAEVERMERERERRLQDDFASQDRNQLRRRDQIVASYASHLSHMRDPQHAPPQAVADMNVVDYSTAVAAASNLEQTSHVAKSSLPQDADLFSRPTSAGEAAAAATAAASYQRSTAPQTAPQPTSIYTTYNGTPAMATSVSHGMTIPPSHSTVPPATSPGVAAPMRSPSQSATLDSADALVALATFAGASQALETSPAPAPRPALGSLSSYTYSMPTASASSAPAPTASTTTYSTSHGFGSSTPFAPSVPAPAQMPVITQTQSSIPSYATIHSQMNGGTPGPTAAAASAVVTQGSFTFPSDGVNNGGSGSVETYVWPPRRRDSTTSAAEAMAALGMAATIRIESNAAAKASDPNQSQ